MKGLDIRTGHLARDFRPVLREWCRIVASYTKREQSDALYWYNERATLSTIASAAARCDADVLEEYGVSKGPRDTRSPGRADIWMRVADREYVGEAKQKWLSITRKKDTRGAILTEALRLARKDAARTRHGETYATPFGIVFVVPYLAKSMRDQCDSRVKSLLEQIEEIDYDAAAWVFPEGRKVLNDAGYLYPGVICLVRSLRRS